ncbi:MAG TPA: SAM-dependent methyltransferase [Polyangia bacterium]|nr:SAM-dependent methyltransferase [Polyangia bacterium]
MDAFIVTSGFEPALQVELASEWTVRPAIAPGLVLADPRAPGPTRSDPVFARQILPGARELHEPSVQRLAEAAYAATEGAVDQNDGPFTLHAFSARFDPMLGSRVELVGRQLLALLRERRRRAFRGYRAPGDFGDEFPRGALLLQLLALDPDRFLVSAAAPRALPRGGTDLAPWPAGAAPVAVDRAPPSRAYQKLEEALRWLGTAPQPGQTCVDLGGAPGGWAYTALRRGARVTAVDRAPLQAPAAGHRGLTAIIGNAFTYEPAQPVDWLLCDVVCEPARSLALIARWLERRWCRRLVATVKFKGREGYGILAQVPPMFASGGAGAGLGGGWRFARVKQLLHNKNEVTVLAMRQA